MGQRVIAKEFKSELMLYDPVQDAVHVLNATASLVYKLHNQGRELEQIEREMRRKFFIRPDEEILQGLQECLAELQEKGLVSRDARDAPDLHQ